MNLTTNLTKTWVLTVLMAALYACSDDGTDGLPTDNGKTILKIGTEDFGTDSPTADTDGRIVRLDAYVFEDGVLAESYENLKGSGGLYELPTALEEGTLYVLGNVEKRPEAQVGSLTEAAFKEAVLTPAENMPLPYYTAQTGLKPQGASPLELTMKQGVARVDLRIRSAGEITVGSLVVENTAAKAFLFPQETVLMPADADRKNLELSFGPGLQKDSAGVFYLYEQDNPDLKVKVRAEMDGKVFESEQSLPQVVKRNAVYAVTVHKDLTGIGLAVEEWETGEGTDLMPGIDSRLTVDTALSTLPDGVEVTDEGGTVVFPYGATELVLAVDCDDELEVLPTEGYPLAVEPVAQTRGLEGKNLFRIRKALYAPGMPSDEAALRFRRKGLAQAYPEDCIRLVLPANPTRLEGLLHFEADTYTHRFDRYIDNELGTFTLPEGKELVVEFDGTEDPWLKVVPREGAENAYRVLAGWMPNDPTANGRVQEGRLVIRNRADASGREEYTVSRRNYGLPVTWLHGVWWCKYNARGNAKSFEDQVLSSDDPAARAGLTVFEYLTQCSASEYYDLWGWAYQGDSGKGMKVTVSDGIAVMDGFRNDVSVHMNKLPADALAPEGYEVPDMEEFNRLFDGKDYVWVMWNGWHELRTPWEGHTLIQREQRRRNDVTVGTLELKDLIYFSMKSPDFPQYEPVVWYGPGAQWNAAGIYHGHYNNMLFTVCSAQGGGWYLAGGMKNLYLTQNGAGNNDTRILRFKKSPVEYIYQSADE